MTEKKTKLHFNGLDGLRAIAACAVVFHHIEFFKFRDGIISLFDNSALKFFMYHIGENGVLLFFVLSGFLITYLLLDEKERFNRISLKKFYLRRVSRIWPLYYLVVLTSFFLLPVLTNHIKYFSATPYNYSQVTNLSNYTIKSFILFITFLPNVALLVYEKFIVGCSQVWSVGIEEQFYIFWPLLILIFSKKQIRWIFIFIIMFYCVTHLSLNPYLKLINRIFIFQYMAIGSLGAIAYKYYHLQTMKIIRNRLLVYPILLLLLCSLIFQIADGFFQKLLLAILFLFLILTSISNHLTVLNNKYVVYLGKISYGIYMYHFMVMYLIIPIANKYLVDNLYVYNLVIYFSVFLLTIMISHLSYKYFESYFLRIKEKKFNS